jgi:glycosyltransferase involved in cell wall biosynthesis
MQNKPFFSIVIPTRNRADLLQQALQSALNQSFTDYEIIVSNNYSHDHTNRVVRNFRNNKVRYYKTKRVMPITDHWEFAVSHAKGEYIIILCDDDALSPNTLDVAARAIKKSAADLVVFPRSTYFSQNWRGQKNTLLIPAHGNQIFEVRNKDVLNWLFNLESNKPLPRLLDSFCNRTLLTKIKKKFGHIFIGACVDYSFCALVLTLADKIMVVDTPLLIAGVTNKSIGASQISARGDAFNEYVREFKNKKLLNYVPLDIPVIPNYIADTLLTVKNFAPCDFHNYDLNWQNYFISCWIALFSQKEYGVNIKPQQKEILKILNNKFANIKGDVRRKLVIVSMWQMLKKIKFIAKCLRAMLYFTKSNFGQKIVYGNKAGFSDILECSKKIENLL